MSVKKVQCPACGKTEDDKHGWLLSQPRKTEWDHPNGGKKMLYKCNCGNSFFLPEFQYRG